MCHKNYVYNFFSLSLHFIVQLISQQEIKNLTLHSSLLTGRTEKKEKKKKYHQTGC